MIFSSLPKHLFKSLSYDTLAYYHAMVTRSTYMRQNNYTVSC